MRKKIIIIALVCFSLLSLIGCNTNSDKKKETTKITSAEKEITKNQETKNYEIDVTVISVDLNNNIFVASHEKYFDTNSETYLVSTDESVYGIPNDYTDEINVEDKLKLKYTYLSNSKDPNIQFIGMEKIN